jgi:general secretion pathway protein D
MRSSLSVRVSLFLLLLPLLACGGGGGGGGGPTEPPPPLPGIVVTPASAPATGVSIATGAATTQTTLILEIRANSVTDLYGVAFDLRYPSTILQLVQASSGPFLGNATLQSVPGSGTGVLIVGLSKLGAAAGTSGSGVLMTLEFRAIAAGQGSFTFEQNSAVNPAGQPITGFGWAAGTVQVTR